MLPNLDDKASFTRKQEIDNSHFVWCHRFVKQLFLNLLFRLDSRLLMNIIFVVCLNSCFLFLLITFFCGNNNDLLELTMGREWMNYAAVVN